MTARNDRPAKLIFGLAPQKDYRAPISGDWYSIDAALPVDALDRINRILDVHYTCAGHDGKEPQISFYMSPGSSPQEEREFALSLVDGISRSRSYRRFPGTVVTLDYHTGSRDGEWSVSLVYRKVRGVQYSKRAWWLATASILERLYRRFYDAKARRAIRTWRVKDALSRPTRKPR